MVKLPKRKLKVETMVMDDAYYQQVELIRMRRSIGLLGVARASAAIAPALRAAMQHALLDERSNLSLIKSFCGKPKLSHWSLDAFAVANVLGRGKFGKVYLSRERRTGCVMALKQLTKKQLQKYKVEAQLRREVEIHSRMSHSNVLRMYDHFFDAAHIYIMLEYAPGR